MFSQFLVKFFIKDPHNINNPEVRSKYGYLSGVIGILANLALFAIKLTTGLVLNSIAFIGDAFNNLTDVASSLVTALGFKLASKPADKEHPFGHGRIEYIAGLIVAFLVILVGYELIKSSIGRILNPIAVSFSLPAFLIVLLSILIKGWLFFFNRYLSKTIDSHTLLATAYDSFSDMISTGLIGISLLASLVTPFPLDGYAGILIAGIILYSGISLVRETISPLLGESPDPDLVKQVKKKILTHDDVLGVHDLIVHSYGPGQYMLSIHIEVPSNKDIMELHESIDHIERQISEELDVLLTVHMDPVNVDCEEVKNAQEEVALILKEFPQVLSFHDFRIVGKNEKINILFDIVVESHITPKEEEELSIAIKKRVREKFPQSHVILTIDKEYTLL